MPLCLIPFDNNIARLETLADAYQFAIFHDEDILARCDRISKRFHGTVRGYYRKLAAWHGSFERFIYIDTDTVATRRLGWIFGLLDRYPLLFADGPSPSNRKNVWNDGVYNSGKLTLEQIGFSANAGFFASCANVFNIETIEAAARESGDLIAYMDLNSSDQPFLNYLAVTSNLPYTSLRTLRWKHGFDNAHIAWWGGSAGGICVRGRFFVLRNTADIVGLDVSVFLVHWAGCSTKIDIGNTWWTDLMGRNPTTGRQTTGMRYKALWNYYAFGGSVRAPHFTIRDI